jgi:hypothetical protein
VAAIATKENPAAVGVATTNNMVAVTAGAIATAGAVAEGIVAANATAEAIATVSAGVAAMATKVAAALAGAADTASNGASERARSEWPNWRPI